MDKIKYFIERSYPYLIALLLTYVVLVFEIKIVSNESLNEMLYGTITADSIILGFLGALIPVVISMKKESNLVAYVLEHDRNKLFSKYIKATIKFGLFSVILTLILYVRTSIESIVIREIMALVWAYTTIAFFILTYRCMNCMIMLLFYKEGKNDKNTFKREDSEEIKEFETKHECNH